MKKLVFLLILTVLLSGCQITPSVEPTEDLWVPPTTQAVPTQTTVREGNLIEVPGRVYDVPWQDRQVQSGEGYTFIDSTIPVFLYSQEEYDAALETVEIWARDKLLYSEGALRYHQILGIAPDLMAASETVSPESRKALGINREEWAQENYYAHYLDFDVVAYSPSAILFGETNIHVYNVSLYRDDAAQPGGWRVRQAVRAVMEPPYEDVDDKGNTYPEPYRPLSFDELNTLGQLGGRILFATELLYQENTTWAYVYLEETNEIVCREVAYSKPISQWVELELPGNK